MWWLKVRESEGEVRIKVERQAGESAEEECSVGYGTREIAGGSSAAFSYSSTESRVTLAPGQLEVKLPTAAVPYCLCHRQKF